jgi:two-component system sporulation sensor kinase A
MGATAALLAHEIGNPLNGIYSTVQMMERHLAKQKEADPLLTSTVQDLDCEIGRLRALLEEFRGLTRLKKLNFQPTNLADLAAELLSLETSHYQQAGISIRQEFAPDLPWVMADAIKLKQLLLNLCKNAVEAMPNGGQLTIRGYRIGRDVTLEVSDTGIGIPEGVNIFKLFTTTKPDGSGLGLAIVRQIASAHGGAITYFSERGKQTTFRLTLPPLPDSETMANHAAPGDLLKQNS